LYNLFIPIFSKKVNTALNSKLTKEMDKVAKEKGLKIKSVDESLLAIIDDMQYMTAAWLMSLEADAQIEGADQDLILALNTIGQMLAEPWLEK